MVGEGKGTALMNEVRRMGGEIPGVYFYRPLIHRQAGVYSVNVVAREPAWA